MAKFRIAKGAARESKAMAAQERDLMTERRRNIHIALEDIDFVWDEDKIKAFRRLWREGANIYELEQELGRGQNEIAVLILDQSIRGRIEQRKVSLV